MEKVHLTKINYLREQRLRKSYRGAVIVALELMA